MRGWRICVLFICSSLPCFCLQNPPVIGLFALWFCLADQGRRRLSTDSLTPNGPTRFESCFYRIKCRNVFCFTVKACRPNYAAERADLFS